MSFTRSRSRPRSQKTRLESIVQQYLPSAPSKLRAAPNRLAGVNVSGAATGRPTPRNLLRSLGAGNPRLRAGVDARAARGARCDLSATAPDESTVFAVR